MVFSTRPAQGLGKIQTARALRKIHVTKPNPETWNILKFKFNPEKFCIMFNWLLQHGQGKESCKI